MKLWTKMVLWSLLLFIVIFNISGIAIIESSHSSELRGELGRVLEQQQTLSSGIGVLLQDGIANTEGFELQILRNYVSSYTRNAMPPGSYLEVLRQDRKAFYQNFPGELSSSRAELKEMKHGVLSIILPGVFSTFGVFLLAQYMTSIPREYIEAAKMDGANRLDIFIKIIIPMSKTGIAALAILTFIDNWNMVEQPLIFVKDVIEQPLSIYLATLNEQEPGIAFAASVFYMLPMLLSFLYWQDYLVEGIEISGIKA